MYRIFQKILIRLIKLFLVEHENLKLYGTQYGGMIIQENEDLEKSNVLSAIALFFSNFDKPKSKAELSCLVVLQEDIKNTNII